MEKLDPALFDVISRRVREDLLEGYAPESALDAVLEDCQLFARPDGPDTAHSLGFVELLAADRDGEPLAGNPWASLRDVTDGNTTRVDARVAGLRMWLMCYAGAQPDGTVSLECVYKDQQPTVARADVAVYDCRVRRWCETVIRLGKVFGARTVEVPRLAEPGTFVLWVDADR